MKKKLISLALVCAMVFALGATALADTEITAPGTGNTSVTYKAPPTYTVTIPAAVELGDTAVTKNISAENVTLEGGKQIKVVLESATYTTSGNEFSAKNGESVVKYSITADSAIGIGDTVATFTADGEKELSFTVTDKSGITVAGDHTETLTFKISVEDSTVPVTGVAITNAPTELTKGDTGTFTANVTPDDATDKTVTWSSSDTSILTVDATTGAYEAIAVGTATITATAGGQSATCTVSVKGILKFEGRYFDYSTGGSVPYSVSIEFTGTDTWGDIVAKDSRVYTQDSAIAPDGKIVKISGLGEHGGEVKSSESTHDYQLVSINDKVTAYSAGSYYLET